MSLHHIQRRGRDATQEVLERKLHIEQDETVRPRGAFTTLFTHPACQSAESRDRAHIASRGNPFWLVNNPQQRPLGSIAPGPKIEVALVGDGTRVRNGTPSFSAIQENHQRPRSFTDHSSWDRSTSPSRSTRTVARTSSLVPESSCLDSGSGRQKIGEIVGVRAEDGLYTHSNYIL